MRVHNFAENTRPQFWQLCITHCGCILVFALALWIRYPRIFEGMPYFYHEDEAHHFNRTVDMVKSGDLNPHYFHKPSLHFYLRIPFVGAAFISEVKAGGATSIKEIRTRDPYGLSDYSFSASHPRIAKWNRALSVGLSLATIVLTYAIAWILFGSTLVATASAALASLSPEFIRYSGTIGVDVVMTFFSVLAVYIGILATQRFSLSLLSLCALSAGLAVSSKYNALPILLVPIVVVFSAHRIGIASAAIALFLPWVGFILGSPFILTSLPLFLDHLAYEVWHYGIAGHEGHMAEPGLAQLQFYLSWLSADGLGLIGLVLCITGIGILLLHGGGVAYPFLIFPLLFFALMVGQKANFTRNMIVVIPFAAICAGAAFVQIHKKLRGIQSDSLRLGVVVLSLIALLGQPFLQSSSERAAALSITESRVDATHWLQERLDKTSDTAIAGQLQFASEARRLPGVHIVDEATSTIPGLFLAGFSRILVSSEFKIPEPLLTSAVEERTIPGQKLPQRLVQNPEIRIFRLNPTEELTKESRSLAERDLRHTVRVRIGRNANGEVTLQCESSDTKRENDCWLSGRYGQLIIVNPEDRFGTQVASGKIKLTFKVMSPWENQNATISVKDTTSPLSFAEARPGEWIPQSIEVPAEVLSSDTPLSTWIEQIHSPATQGLGPDTRRLGVAIQ